MASHRIRRNAAIHCRTRNARPYNTFYGMILGKRGDDVGIVPYILFKNILEITMGRIPQNVAVHCGESAPKTAVHPAVHEFVAWQMITENRWLL